MFAKLAHILFACLLLTGSTGLVVNKHYCQNQLKNTALFLKARGCHSGGQTMSCPMHADMGGHSGDAERKDCCDDETEYLKAEEDQIVSTFEWELKKPVPVLLAACHPMIKAAESAERQLLHYLNYKPPLIVYDLSLRLQTFLC